MDLPYAQCDLIRMCKDVYRLIHIHLISVVLAQGRPKYANCNISLHKIYKAASTLEYTLWRREGVRPAGCWTWMPSILSSAKTSIPIELPENSPLGLSAWALLEHPGKDAIATVWSKQQYPSNYSPSLFSSDLSEPAQTNRFGGDKRKNKILDIFNR